MPSLKEVRGRIVSVNSTQQITKAMKMVSAAKLRRAQDNIVKIRPYSQKLSGILQNVTATLEATDIDNPYSVQKTPEKILLVAITSDRGLAGAFNSNIGKAILALIKSKYSTQSDAGNVTILTIGKKGNDYFKRRNFNLISDFTTVYSNLSFDSVKNAAEYVMNAFVTGAFDKVELVYNEFKNVATQIVKIDTFLPLKEEEINSSEAKFVNTDYIFEPSKIEIVKDLIPKSLKIQFYKAILESNASEHGARMTAMDKATDNAKELLKELRLTYNRSRQAAITKEILEIVGGAEALKG